MQSMPFHRWVCLIADLFQGLGLAMGTYTHLQDCKQQGLVCSIHAIRHGAAQLSLQHFSVGSFPLSLKDPGC